MGCQRRRSSQTGFRAVSRRDIQYLLDNAEPEGTNFAELRKQFPFSPGLTTRNLEVLHKRISHIRNVDKIEDADQVYRSILSLQWTDDKETALRAAVHKFGTKWKTILQESASGVLGAFSEEQIRSKWRRMAEERIRKYRLLDLDDGTGRPREYRTHSVTTAARTAAKIGSELLRFLDLTSNEVHAFQVIDGHRVRKICIEPADDDLDATPLESMCSTSSSSQSDWVQSLSQESALNLSMLWDLNVEWNEATPSTPIHQHPSIADWSPNPTVHSQRPSAVGAIRLQRKLLRDKLRELKAMKASNAMEKQALREQKQRIRMQLSETDNYTDQNR